MLSDERFREIYALLDHGQTVDETGAPVDCGVRCGKFCCSPATTKYLLPGESQFLEREMARSQRTPFRLTSTIFFDTFAPLDPDHPPDCICASARDIRSFNCRAFPYAPTVEGTQVVGLHRNQIKYLEPCWIQRPGFDWARGAMRAWQIVLDDDDCRFLFARMAVLWEWSNALDRGETPGPVLSWLARLDKRNPAQSWDVSLRFFHRSDP